MRGKRKEKKEPGLEDLRIEEVGVKQQM